MSLKTVMNPHRKNSEVMIANGPRYVSPSPEESAARDGSEEEGMMAISGKEVFQIFDESFTPINVRMSAGRPSF